MYGSTACSSSETYARLAEQYRERMWATPIFTEARVAHEKKANEYQRMSESAARTCNQEGTSATGAEKAKKAKKAFKPSTSADVEAAALANSSAAPGISGTHIAIAIGGIALLGGAAVLLTRKKA